MCGGGGGGGGGAGVLVSNKGNTEYEAWESCENSDPEGCRGG